MVHLLGGKEGKNVSDACQPSALQTRYAAMLFIADARFRAYIGFTVISTGRIKLGCERRKSVASFCINYTATLSPDRNAVSKPSRPAGDHSPPQSHWNACTTSKRNCSSSLAYWSLVRSTSCIICPTPTSCSNPSQVYSSSSGAMDAASTFTKPLNSFMVDSVRLVRRCNKPDRKGMCGLLPFQASLAAVDVSLRRGSATA
jgi:hypothetical protein